MNDDHDLLLMTIRHVFPNSRLEPATAAQLATIRQQHPEVPTHYLEFLQHIGWGSLGPGNFMIYNGLCEPHEIYDEDTAATLAGVFILGDDFGGDAVGFDTRQSWALVRIDSYGEVDTLEESTLAAFIAQRLAV